MPRSAACLRWRCNALGYAGDVVRYAFRRDFVLSSKSVRLMHIWPTLVHSKAERELGWQPEPVHEAVRRAARFFQETGGVRRRTTGAENR